MKITKRQLRRIIREQHDRDVNAGWDYDPDSEAARAGQAEVEQMQYDEYDAWVFQTGQVTPAASSVMATYFVEQELTDDKEQIDTIAMGYRVDPQDVMRDIKRQQSEQSAVAGIPVQEGMSPEDMPDSWRQILGDCLGENK